MSTESAAGDLMGTAKEPKERVARMAESQPVRDSFMVFGGVGDGSFQSWI